MVVGVMCFVFCVSPAIEISLTHATHLCQAAQTSDSAPPTTCTRTRKKPNSSCACRVTCRRRAAATTMGEAECGSDKLKLGKSHPWLSLFSSVSVAHPTCDSRELEACR